MRTHTKIMGGDLIGNPIKTERTHLFAPAANIVVKADISGGAEAGELESAIEKAVGCNGILFNKIETDEDGRAWYSAIDKPVISIVSSESNWEKIAARQEGIRFETEKGELLRFFLSSEGDKKRLLIIAHHLAGDGLSVCCLLQDIMSALAGWELTYRPLKLLSSDSFPKDSSLGFPLKLMMNAMNNKWRKTGKAFTFEDFRRMFERYWSERETVIFVSELASDKLNRLALKAKEHCVTINSAITTAFIRAAGGRPDTGLAVSIREPGYDGMGNYATGISIVCAYDEKKDFWQNAVSVQRHVYRKINSNKSKYFLLRFLDGLEPTLIDATYFAAFDGYKNDTASRFQRMFGFGEAPKDLSITNLTRLPIKEAYGKYLIDDLVFSAPLAANAKRMIGIATLGGKMKLAMRVLKNGEAAADRALLDKAVDYLISESV